MEGGGRQDWGYECVGYVGGFESCLGYTVVQVGGDVLIEAKSEEV